MEWNGTARVDQVWARVYKDTECGSAVKSGCQVIYIALRGHTLSEVVAAMVTSSGLDSSGFKQIETNWADGINDRLRVGQRMDLMDLQS